MFPQSQQENQQTDHFPSRQGQLQYKLIFFKSEEIWLRNINILYQIYLVTPRYCHPEPKHLRARELPIHLFRDQRFGHSTLGAPFEFLIELEDSKERLVPTPSHSILGSITAAQCLLLARPTLRSSVRLPACPHQPLSKFKSWALPSIETEFGQQ